MLATRNRAVLAFIQAVSGKLPISWTDSPRTVGYSARYPMVIPRRSAPVYGLAFCWVPIDAAYPQLERPEMVPDHRTCINTSTTCSQRCLIGDLIACHLPDMLVAQSIRAGRISPSPSCASRYRQPEKQAVLRLANWVRSSHHISAGIYRRCATPDYQAAQNKCEGFNNLQWAYFDRTPRRKRARRSVEIIKYNHLIMTLLNCYTMTQAFKELEAEGMS